MGGGASEVLPLHKGSAGKVLAMLGRRGGHNKVWSSIKTGA